CDGTLMPIPFCQHTEAALQANAATRGIGVDPPPAAARPLTTRAGVHRPPVVGKQRATTHSPGGRHDTWKRQARSSARRRNGKEIEGMLRGNHPTRAEESHDSEPPADDDLSVTEQVQRPERPAGNE